MLRFRTDPLAGLLGGGGGPVGGGAPPSIMVPRGGGGDMPLPGDQTAPGADTGQGPGIPGKPDSQKVTDLVNQAADMLMQAAQIEKDPQDKAMISDLVAKAHKFAGDQQGLVDKVMGGGPGVKMIRKAAPAGGGGGAGY